MAYARWTSDNDAYVFGDSENSFTVMCTGPVLGEDFRYPFPEAYDIGRDGCREDGTADYQQTLQLAANRAAREAAHEDNGWLWDEDIRTGLSARQCRRFLHEMKDRGNKVDADILEHKIHCLVEAEDMLSDSENENIR